MGFRCSLSSYYLCSLFTNYMKYLTWKSIIIHFFLAKREIDEPGPVFFKHRTSFRTSERDTRCCSFRTWFLVMQVLRAFAAWEERPLGREGDKWGVLGECTSWLVSNSWAAWWATSPKPTSNYLYSYRELTWNWDSHRAKSAFLPTIALQSVKDEPSICKSTLPSFH